MKNKNLAILFFLSTLIISVNLTSCLEDECTEQRVFVEYESVYVQPNEFRVDIETVQSREMVNTGKIYFYNDMILINEKYEGVHVIDNSNPENPVNTAFIKIPGNLDVAIKGTKMYADNYVDLLTIDINDINNPLLLCRDEDVFKNYNFSNQLGYFIYHKPTERRISVDCLDPNFGDRFFVRNNNPFVLFDANAGGGFLQNVDASGNATDVGVGGSLARFSLVNDFLYVINNTELTAFDLANSSKPTETQTTRVSWGIETLFPYKNYLFIGANNGMYIYDINNPEAPEYVSEFRHARACDPVFVKDDIAYVTLRDGTICQNFINQIDILDVKNITNPTLIASFDMDNPHGLSVRDNNLYLCEGDYGLKVFKTDNLESLASERIEHVKDINAIDVISLSKDHLLLIGDNGLYQYDTSDPSDLKEMSYLAVKN